MSRRPRDRRGLSESVQWATLVPVLLLLVLGAVQVGIVLQARSAAGEAALAGAEAGAVLGASADSAESVSRRVAENSGLRDVEIVVRQGTGVVHVEVRARTSVFFDIGQSTVLGEAEMAVER